MIDLHQMRVKALKDAAEISGYVPLRSGNRLFGRSVKTTVNPRLLAVSKRASGQYYISRGFVDFRPIAGTDALINLTEGTIASVRYQVTEELEGDSIAGPYLTGNYQVVSADLVFGEPPPDQETLTRSTYYHFLFVWSDQLLRRQQGWTNRIEPILHGN